jgi:chorismate dehydratase
LTPENLPRVCAVSYLNTTPLVWGMVHGRQQRLFDLSFCLPSVCADRLATGAADLGIVPVVEAARQNLAILPGTCIASHGAVRSILLVSKKPFEEIQTLSADSSSRTSVQLARVILAKTYGANPTLSPHAPDLDSMLASADAALIIGDPALRLDPATLPYRTLDLGAEWWNLTRLPMVFAVWAGPAPLTRFRQADFLDSYYQGALRIPEIAATESAARGITGELALHYLTRNIVFELGASERAGMQRFLELVAALPAPRPAKPILAGAVPA